MITKFTGVVKHLSETQTGTSKNQNDWAKKDLVLTNADPRLKSIHVAFSFWNERIKELDELKLKEGDLVEVEFIITSDEYMGRWIPKITGRSVIKLKRRKEDRDADIINSLKTLLLAAQRIDKAETPDKKTAKELVEAVGTIIKNSDIPDSEQATILKGMTEVGI